MPDGREVNGVSTTPGRRAFYGDTVRPTLEGGSQNHVVEPGLAHAVGNARAVGRHIRH